jgi:hypothetical protein
MKKRVDWNKFRAAGPSAEYNERVRKAHEEWREQKARKKSLTRIEKLKKKWGT